MKIRVKSNAQPAPDREATHRMIKQKDQKYYFVKSKETGKITRAKEEYAKKLASENKVGIVGIEN